MRRYALVGASKLLEGHTDLGMFGLEMAKEFGHGIDDILPEIFERSKGVVNQFQTATGKSDVAKEINRQIGITKARETPVSVRPLTALKQAYAAQEKAGAAGYRRGVREAAAAGKEALNQMKAQLSVADKWMAGDQEQVRRNMIDFVQTVLPREERGRFINQITSALKRPRLVGGDPSKLYSQAWNVMRNIEERARVMWHEDLVNEISNLHDQILDSSGVSVEAKGLLRDQFKDVQLEKPITPSSAERLERIKQAGKALPSYLREKLENFYKTPLRNLSLEELEALRDDAWLTREVGRQQWKDLKEARAQEEAIRARDLASSSTRPRNELERMVRERSMPIWTQIKDRLWNTVATGLNWASVHEKARLFMGRLFETLDGHGDGWLLRNVYEPLMTQERAYLNDFNPVRDKATEIATRNKLGYDDFQRIGIHAHAMQDGTEAELLKYSTEPDVMRKMIADYKAQGLTRGQQELYDFFRKTLDEQVPEFIKFFADNYNQELKFYENYFPRQIDPRKSAKWWSRRQQFTNPVSGEIVDINNVADTMRALADYNYRLRSVRRGFAKARIEGAEIPVNLNAMDVFLKHQNDWAYVKSMQPHMNMIGRIANTDLFAAKYGQVGKSFVLDYLDALARRGHYSRNIFEQAMDGVRNRTMVGVLGFRLNQFKHLANYPLGMYEAGGANWWAHGVAAGHTVEGQALINRLWPEIGQAMGGDVTIREAAEIGKKSRAAFIVDRQLDYQNRVGTAFGKYLQQLDRAGYNWMDFDKVPDNQVFANVSRRAYENAVGSVQTTARPLIVTRGTSVGSASIGKAVMAYQTPKMVRWGVVRSAIMEDLMRQGKPLKAAAKLSLSAASSLIESGVKFGSRAAYTAGASAILALLGYPVFQRQRERSMAKQILTEAGSDLASVVPGGMAVQKAVAVSEYPRSAERILSQTGVPPIDQFTATMVDTGQWMIDPTNAKASMRMGQTVLFDLGVPVSTPMMLLNTAAQLSDQKGQAQKDREELRSELGLGKGERLPSYGRRRPQ
jgi:hypothetical protein